MNLRVTHNSCSGCCYLWEQVSGHQMCQHQAFIATNVMSELWFPATGPGLSLVMSKGSRSIFLWPLLLICWPKKYLLLSILSQNSALCLSSHLGLSCLLSLRLISPTTRVQPGEWTCLSNFPVLLTSGSMLGWFPFIPLPSPLQHSRSG